jgi:aerobic C4-dicarboxylate transport protein
MKAAPLGAFGAMAFTIGKYGVGALANLAGLVATFYLTSLLFVLVVLGAVARLAGFNILHLIRYLKAELLLVLGTSSSEAALPSLIEKMERAGCRKSVVGLVVPTGYSFNLDGTNIYMTLAALFIAQATNVHLSLEQQLLLLLVAMLSSKGAAGVTGAGFITLAATLSIVPSVPVAGMTLILGVDRFMSEFIPAHSLRRKNQVMICCNFRRPRLCNSDHADKPPPVSVKRPHRPPRDRAVGHVRGALFCDGGSAGRARIGRRDFRKPDLP